MPRLKQLITDSVDSEAFPAKKIDSALKALKGLSSDVKEDDAELELEEDEGPEAPLPTVKAIKSVVKLLTE